MDVFSLVKFWRNAGVGDPGDDEGSLFDLVFTTPTNLVEEDSPTTVNVISQQCSSNHSLLYFNNNNNKRKILPLDSSSSSTNTNTNTKTTPPRPRSPFRVLMLGFQKSTSKEMKCEIVEEVTISSLFKRDNSLRRSKKRFSVSRYLNLIRPLVNSRRPNESERSSFSFYASSPATIAPTSVFRNKSRSSSSSVSKPIPSRRRDYEDSALELDGIQSAILHCKKSYNSPSSSQPDGWHHVLSRSGSAPSHPQGPRISVDDVEIKRTSI